MQKRLFSLRTALLITLFFTIITLGLPTLNISTGISITEVEATAPKTAPEANFTLVDWVVGSNFVIVNGGVIRNCWNMTGPAWSQPCRFQFGGSYDPDGDLLDPLFSIKYWNWDWGDGSAAENNTYPAANHTYATAGTYTINLTVTDNEAWSMQGGVGSGDSFTKDVTVTLMPPEADFTMTPTNPVVGVEIIFNASASSDTDGSIVSYEWDFGDGTTGTGVSVTKTYTTEAFYTVVLTVTDDDDLTDTKTVNVPLAPVFAFTVKVVGSNGTAIAGVNVSATSNPTWSDITNASGIAQLLLPNGTYELTATSGSVTLLDTIITVDEAFDISLILDSSPYAMIVTLQGDATTLEAEIVDLEAELATALATQGSSNDLYIGLGAGAVVGLVIGLAIMFIRK